jgi:hypothetical protein
MAGPTALAGEEISKVGQYSSMKKLTTTVAVGGLGLTRPGSRLPVLSTKAWPVGSISIL